MVNCCDLFVGCWLNFMGFPWLWCLCLLMCFYFNWFIWIVLVYFLGFYCFSSFVDCRLCVCVCCYRSFGLVGWLGFVLGNY